MHFYACKKGIMIDQISLFLHLFKGMLYLEKELVFCDSLDWFDQVRGDGVGKAMSLLDFL